MYFISSDFHFSHNRMLEFERRKFRNLYEHNQAILDMLRHKLIDNRPKATDTFYFLGDFGMPRDDGQMRQLEEIFALTECRTVAVLGNHDKKEFRHLVEALFDEVHEYPIYVSHKLVLSHYPVPVLYNDEPSPVINVHGHTHASYIDGPNYMCASWAVAGYRCVSEKAVNNRFARLPKMETKFLYEPYAKNYVFTPAERDDIIYNVKGEIDIELSREAVRRKKEERDARESPFCHRDAKTIVAAVEPTV